MSSNKATKATNQGALMYTYRISITSDIADIYGTFSQEKPLTYGDFTREIRALMPADDEAKEIKDSIKTKGGLRVRRRVMTRSGGVATAECELID